MKQALQSGLHFGFLHGSRFCRRRKLGEAILKAIEQYDGTVASLPAVRYRTALLTISVQKKGEQLHPRVRPPDGRARGEVVGEGQFKEFCNMLPEYADYCYAKAICTTR